MEDSFRVRVDKAFGSLGGNTPSFGASPSPWSLTDEEIERREWNRHKEDEEDEAGDESGPSAVGDLLESDFRDLTGREEEDEEEDLEIDGDRKRRRQNDGSARSCAETTADEYLDVQSNIGRDCTLDYEEEEDEYDKVAVGAEQAGDRLYMRDVKLADYEVDERNVYGELPDSFQTVLKDPRANHVAAKIRLKEDAEAAGNFNTSEVSVHSEAMVAVIDNLKKEVGGDSLKPILRKKENLEDSKSQKRVRFMFDPKSRTQSDGKQQASGASDSTSVPWSTGDDAVLKQAPYISEYSSASGLPDYLRNPSKYTRYTLDSSDEMDDESNRKAYMDLFNDLRKRDPASSLDETSVEIPRTIVFTPKKKPEDHSMVTSRDSEHDTGDNVKNKSRSIGVAAEEAQESEMAAMEEDEPCLAVDKSTKPGRQYRARANVKGGDDST